MSAMKRPASWKPKEVIQGVSELLGYLGYRSKLYHLVCELVCEPVATGAKPANRSNRKSPELRTQCYGATLRSTPESDFGSGGWGFESLRVCQQSHQVTHFRLPDCWGNCWGECGASPRASPS